jgi:hypothetical protein
MPVVVVFLNTGYGGTLEMEGRMLRTTKPPTPRPGRGGGGGASPGTLGFGVGVLGS